MLLKIEFVFYCALLEIAGCSSKPSNTENTRSEEIPFYEMVRNAHAMAYDYKKSSVYIFGGANDKHVVAELAILRDSTWNALDIVNEPTPRTFSSLVYDGSNDRLVLFGGNRVLFGTGPNLQNLLSVHGSLKIMCGA